MVSKGRKQGNARFTLKLAHKPRTVQVCGDFSNWKPVVMKQMKDGTFEAEVAMPSCGVTQYKFLIDGQWQVDPENNAWAANSFGTVNSVARLS